MRMRHRNGIGRSCGRLRDDDPCTLLQAKRRESTTSSNNLYELCVQHRTCWVQVARCLEQRERIHSEVPHTKRFPNKNLTFILQ